MRLIRRSNDARWRGRRERPRILILDNDYRDPSFLCLGDILTEQLSGDLRLDDDVCLLRDALIDPLGIFWNRSLPVVDDKFEPGGLRGLLESGIDEARVRNSRNGHKPHGLSSSRRSVECRTWGMECRRRRLCRGNSLLCDGDPVLARYPTSFTRVRSRLIGRRTDSSAWQAECQRSCESDRDHPDRKTGCPLPAHESLLSAIASAIAVVDTCTSGAWARARFFPAMCENVTA